MQLDRIALRLPMLLLLLGAVIFAIDIPDVVSAVAVSIGLQEYRAPARGGPSHPAQCHFLNRAHILTVARGRFDPEGSGAAKNRSRRRLSKMRVLVVEIVFAN